MRERLLADEGGIAYGGGSIPTDERGIVPTDERGIVPMEE